MFGQQSARCKSTQRLLHQSTQNVKYNHMFQSHIKMPHLSHQDNLNLK